MSTEYGRTVQSVLARNYALSGLGARVGGCSIACLFSLLLQQWKMQAFKGTEVLFIYELRLGRWRGAFKLCEWSVQTMYHGTFKVPK